MNRRTGATFSPLPSIGTFPSEVVELLDFVEDVMFWIKDEQGQYAWANRAFIINFGLRDHADVSGKTDFDTCCAPMADQYRVDDELVLTGQRIIGRMELIPRFDHTARWWVTSKIPVHDQAGRVVGTAGITRPADPAEKQSQPVSGLSEAILHVRQHYGENIDNRALARACGLSVRTFERQFKATYHCSPHDYVRQIRVRMSLSSLVYSQKKISEVAAEFGFADQSHYSKEFHRLMGETPRRYRARCKR